MRFCDSVRSGSSVFDWKTTPSRCSAAPGLRRTSFPRMRIAPVTLS